MATVNKKYKLRFFFDYGAGGCLWAGDDLTRQEFGFGPLDKVIAERTGKISPDTIKLIEKIDELHEDYYNKEYPPDPSLWRQNECNLFNQQVEILLESLIQQMSSDFEIIDKQTRYTEDKDLEEYLKNKKEGKRSN